MILYNEIDPFAAQWLRNLAAANQITPGVVDERDIRTIKGADLAGVRRAHFFAGIGGWDYALRLAGWPEDREVWTGSCPCQPFSTAGKRKGEADERHLWPAFFQLIAECRPGVIFGEQVAGRAGLGWLDGVFADLEREGYACGAVVVGAHSVGAPHIRQRLYWVADAQHAQRRPLDLDGQDGRDGANQGRQEAHGEPGACSQVHGMGDTDGEGYAVGVRQQGGDAPPLGEAAGEAALQGGAWRDSYFIPCTDGPARRVGRGVFPLAYGIPRDMGRGVPELRSVARSASKNRVGRLRGYGNAIIPALAAEFVKAYMDTL